jgi:hypothetical protein
LADAEQVAEFVQSIPDVEWSGLVASPQQCQAGHRHRAADHRVRRLGGRRAQPGKCPPVYREASTRSAEVASIVHDAGGGSR